jgi:hypothetical protein
MRQEFPRRVGGNDRRGNEMTRDGKMAEINRNAGRFEELLPGLLADHEGQYVLMQGGRVIGFFPSATEAQMAGNDQFVDGVFSIQKITEEVEHLGRYAYALSKQ